MLLNINNKINITLCGMMGSGKSAIGKILANKLNYNFIDVDKIIENETKKTIKKIFEEDGEVYFRDLEEKITLQILRNKNVVVALGGGTFLNKKIRNEILKNHNSIWLDWDTEILIKRIKNNPKRPIAFNSTDDELTNLIKKRDNTYSKALYSINCNNLTKKQIVDKIIKIYETN